MKLRGIAVAAFILVVTSTAYYQYVIAHHPVVLQQCPGLQCDYLTGGQYSEMEASISTACPDMQLYLMAYLWTGHWGRHWTDYSRRGRHYPEQHWGGSTFHFTIQDDHPGFDTSFGLQTRRTELAGLMVHEVYHHLHPGADEIQISQMTKARVPDYQGL